MGGTAEAGRDGAGGGGGAVRRGLGLPGLHKSSRGSSAGGTPPLFPPPQPSGEQPLGDAGWAAARGGRKFAIAEIARTGFFFKIS